MVCTDRVLVTLVHLRTGLTYEALGAIYEVGTSPPHRAGNALRDGQVDFPGTGMGKGLP
ncbi:transposase family protein [Streptomyces bobili]|uniref:transposase family protein n=1 Tax=Streptomyces bobili TaxID=67280 RepID=UPI0038178C3A